MRKMKKGERGKTKVGSFYKEQRIMDDPFGNYSLHHSCVKAASSFCLDHYLPYQDIFLCTSVACCVEVREDRVCRSHNELKAPLLDLKKTK